MPFQFFAKYGGQLFRNLFYRPRGLHMGADSYVRRPYKITNPEQIFIGRSTIIHGHAIIQPLQASSTIEIGSNVYIGRHAFVSALHKLIIGDGCVLSDFVYINDASHGFDPTSGPILSQPIESRGPIILGKNCFLGYRSVVLPGVTLGEHTIVGANSVVTRSFPGFCMLGGVPAKVLKIYDHEQKLWRKPSPS